MNKYLLVALSLLFFTACTYSKSPQSDYYGDLERSCNNDSCCLSSVITMKDMHYGEMTGGTCSAGFHVADKGCGTSKKWCAPNDLPL